MLLAIDTSTSVIGAACAVQGKVCSQASVEDARRHGELLAPLIAQAIAEAAGSMSQLKQVVVGVGPGPFTGLRVGITTAVVIGHVCGVPVQGVCSLDALALQALESHAIDPLVHPEFLVATDARRKEVYWAHYAANSGVPARIGRAAVNRAGDLPAELRELPAVGRGPGLYPEALRSCGGPTDVSASALARVALAPRAELLPAQPLYLRRPDAVPRVQTSG